MLPARSRVQSHGGRPRVAILVVNAAGASGVVRASFSLAGSLAARHDVELVSVLGRGNAPRYAVPADVKLTFLAVRSRRARRSRRDSRRGSSGPRPPRGGLLHPGDPKAREMSAWTDLLLARRLRRLDADVLIGTRYSLSLAAARLVPPGVAIIAQEHMHLRAKKPYKREVILGTYSSVDAVVTLTDTDRREYETALGSRTRVVAIPNVVTPLGGPASDVSGSVILAAGRLVWQKGFDRLIRAFARVAQQEPDCMLRICGDGRAHAQLRQLCIQLGVQDRVQFPGFVGDLGVEMQRASIFALSSRYEGFPLVLTEAMSKGLPVVAFDCPTGPSDVVQDGLTGVLVRNGDIAAFADGLLQLVRDASTRRRLGAEAVRQAQAYTAERIGRQWDEVLADVLPGR